MKIKRSSGEKLGLSSSTNSFEKGDKLLLVGAPEDFEAFDYLAKENLMLPKEGESCLWVSIPKNSDLASQKLEEIKQQQQSGVIIQGIRRKNQYIRFPDVEKDIKAGDNILLFGKLDRLTQLTESII